jgi:hypothetical protein
VTALETFNAGISKPSITSASTLDLQNQTINVGSTQIATGAITLGSALSTTTMNGKVIASTIVSYGQLNINTNVSTNIDIGNQASRLNTTTLQGKSIIIGTSGKSIIGTSGKSSSTQDYGSTIQMGTTQQNTHTKTIGTNNGNTTTTNVQGQTLNLTSQSTLDVSTTSTGTINIGATNTTPCKLNLNSTTTNIKGATAIELETTSIGIGNSGIFTGPRFITVEATSAESTVSLQAGGELRSLSIHKFNNLLKLNYSPTVLAAGQLGFEIAYTGAVTTASPTPGDPWGLAVINFPNGVYSAQGFAAGYAGIGYCYMGFPFSNGALGGFGTNTKSALYMGVVFLFTITSAI